MAKKTTVKVRLVPESKPDSSFFYYVKKPTSGEKAKKTTQKMFLDTLSKAFDTINNAV